mmetsp:Transcript_15040/g.43435  ORF Transcript_15040/g.43435 Transcript_15040/m.43435 type:complete len:255 (-) Transcript_15040:770-1534(-)
MQVELDSEGATTVRQLHLQEHLGAFPQALGEDMGEPRRSVQGVGRELQQRPFVGRDPFWLRPKVGQRDRRARYHRHQDRVQVPRHGPAGKRHARRGERLLADEPPLGEGGVGGLAGARQGRWCEPRSQARSLPRRHGSMGPPEGRLHCAHGHASDREEREHEEDRGVCIPGLCRQVRAPPCLCRPRGHGADGGVLAKCTSAAGAVDRPAGQLHWRRRRAEARPRHRGALLIDEARSQSEWHLRRWRRAVERVLA